MCLLHLWPPFLGLNLNLSINTIPLLRYSAMCLLHVWASFLGLNLTLSRDSTAMLFVPCQRDAGQAVHLTAEISKMCAPRLSPRLLCDKGEGVGANLCLHRRPCRAGGDIQTALASCSGIPRTKNCSGFVAAAVEQLWLENKARYVSQLFRACLLEGHAMIIEAA